jgi:hypothetical protein
VRAAALLLALAGALAGIAACANPPTLFATGIVTDVQGPSVAEVHQFTLRTDEGEVLVFVVDALALDGGGKPAPHLREHLLSGQRVAVEYLLAGRQRKAIRYYDAR